MEHHPDSGACEDLIPKPLAKWGGDCEGREKSGADRKDNAAGDGERNELADDGDEPAGNHGEDDAGEEEGENLDAGFNCGGVFDGLEIEWEVKDEGEKRCTKRDGEDNGRCDGALREDTGWEGGEFA